MKVSEVADLLAGLRSARRFEPGRGGSTTLAMEDPATHTGRILNSSADNANGRAVSSNLYRFVSTGRIIKE